MAFTGLTVGATPTATGAAFAGNQILFGDKTPSLGLASDLAAQANEYADGSDPLKNGAAGVFVNTSRPSGAAFLFAGDAGFGAREKLGAKKAGYQMMALTIPGADTVISGGVIEKMLRAVRGVTDFQGRDLVASSLTGTVKLGNPIKALCDCLAVVDGIDRFVSVIDIFHDWMEINDGVLKAVKGALATMEPGESLEDNNTTMFLALNHNPYAWNRVFEDANAGQRTKLCRVIMSQYLDPSETADPSPEIVAMIREWRGSHTARA